MEMIPIFGIVVPFAATVLIVYYVTKSRQRRVEVQAEMQSRLIDRFGSAPELVEFLHSPAGKQFVVGVQSAPIALTRERILGGFTRAIVLTALGAGFMFIAFFDRDDDWIIPAAIVFSLGIGYLIATAVSYKLSKRLGGVTEMPPMSNGEVDRV